MYSPCSVVGSANSDCLPSSFLIWVPSKVVSAAGRGVAGEGGGETRPRLSGGSVPFEKHIYYAYCCHHTQQEGKA